VGRREPRSQMAADEAVAAGQEAEGAHGDTLAGRGQGLRELAPATWHDRDGIRHTLTGHQRQSNVKLPLSAAFLPISLILAACAGHPTAAGHSGAHWSYEGATGPAH
jgi:hypothetical protein